MMIVAHEAWASLDTDMVLGIYRADQSQPRANQSLSWSILCTSLGYPSAIDPRCSVAHPRRMNDMACECRATMGSLVVVGREEAREEAEAEAHPASR